VRVSRCFFSESKSPIVSLFTGHGTIYPYFISEYMRADECAMNSAADLDTSI